MKGQFLYNEIFALTIQAAFQRSNIYKPGINDNDKLYFKRKLRGYLDNLLESYKTKVSEEIHIQNIESLSEYSVVFNILQNGKLNIGVAQKLLNLYLKYHWCLGTIPEPPHCPVDRKIQENLKVKPIVSWTKMTSIKEYKEVIERFKEKCSKGQSLARLELDNFERNT